MDKGAMLELAALNRVDVAAEYRAFAAWWESWCPGQPVPAPSAHTFDAWLASARYHRNPLDDALTAYDAAIEALASQVDHAR